PSARRGSPTRLLAQVDPDALGLGVEVEPGHPRLAAEAGGFVAAVRRGGVVEIEGVDPDGPRVEGARGAVGLLDVAGPDGRGEPVGGVVRLRDRRIEIVELDHGEDRPEDLLAGDRHRITDAVEDRRLPEITPTVADLGRLPAQHELRPFLLSDLDVTSDLVDLGLGHLGPEPRLRIQRVALHELLRALDDLLEESLVYVLRDEEARAGGADLALVVEDRAHRAATGCLEVGVVEHDD